MSDGAGLGKPTSDEALRALLKRLGPEVKAMRARLGWTQKEAAEHAGLSTSAYAELENGKRNPTFRTVVKVATAYGLDLPDLLRDAIERDSLSQ